MKLIDAYINEVTRRLPKKMRQDIALKLRSTIEDMLPEHYSEWEVKNVLSKLGSPAELAASYRDTPRFLIGPQVYDAYFETIKVFIPWAIFITLLVHIVESTVLFTGEAVLLSAIIKTLATTFADIITVLVQVLFWITLVFVIIERTAGLKGKIPRFNRKSNWTPDDLKNIKIIPIKKNIPITDIAFSFFGTVILAILYFNADRFAGLYKSNANGKLEFITPLFNQEILLSYWPIVVSLTFLSVVLSLYKLKMRKWTMPIAGVNTIVHLLSSIVFIIIITDTNLIHETFIPQMAETMQMTPSTVATFINRIIWVSIAIMIVTNIFDIFNSFRKAKMN